MIVPMKKLSILLYHKERESFLAALQELGVVHIVENAETTSSDLAQLQKKVKQFDEVIKALQKTEKGLSDPVTQDQNGDPDALVQEYFNHKESLDSIEQQKNTLQKDIRQLTPWGDFDQNVLDKLSQVGIGLRFFEIAEKKFDALPKDDLYLEVISRQNGSVNFVVFEFGGEITVEADEVILPDVSLARANKNLDELEANQRDIYSSLQNLTKYKQIVQAKLDDISNLINFETARISMGQSLEGRVLSLNGWLPKKNEAKVKKFLEKFTAWYSIDEPANEDCVPVKLNNHGGFKLFEPLTKIFSLPDYFEIDPTPFFAPFFALFVGLCLADLGYGALLFSLALVAFFKVPSNFKSITQLVMIFGVTTMFGGFILNTFFGAPIFADGASNVGMAKLAFLSTITTPDGNVIFPAMAFAVYLGLVQMLLGTFLKAINNYNSGGIKFAFGPMGSFFLITGVAIFLVQADFLDLRKFNPSGVPFGELIAGIPSSFATGIVALGLVLTMLFNSPAKKIGFNVSMTIVAIYNFATGFLGDSLSYIRLFALGLAGGLLGLAFNQIALSLITTDSGPNFNSFLVIFTVLIMIVGHALNFFLALIGSFVHPLRLTFVEFYKNLDFKGGSVPFKPLSKKNN